MSVHARPLIKTIRKIASHLPQTTVNAMASRIRNRAVSHLAVYQSSDTVRLAYITANINSTDWQKKILAISLKGFNALTQPQKNAFIIHYKRRAGITVAGLPYIARTAYFQWGKPPPRFVP